MKNRDVILKLKNLPNNTNEALENKSDKNHTHKYAGSSSAGGAATSANKVNKALTIQANGTSLASFNGSSAKTVNITPSNIGAAASSHTHNYAGSSSAGGAADSANKVNNQLNIILRAMQGGTRVAFDGSASQTILINPANIGAAYESHTHNYAGSSSAGGSANSANKVNSVLNISLNGTLSAQFNGSKDISLNVTPANIGATTETYVNNSISALDLYDDNKNIYIKNSAGTLGSGLHGTIVRYISPTSFTEFLQMTQNPGVYYVLNKVTTTYNNNTVTILGLIDSRKSGSNYSYYGIQKMNQFVVNSSGQITSYSHLTQYILSQIPSTYAGSSSAGGSATSAEKVNHKLTITNYDLDINESFDGSTDITLDLTPDTLGAAWKDHGTHVTFSTTAPKANGTAAVGTATTVSRSDHVHPLQTTVSGNAGTATKLATARTISLTGDVTGSTTFDGSANKSIATKIPIPEAGSWFKGFAKVNTDGVIEVGKYIDFHLSNTGTTDYDGRITLSGDKAWDFGGSVTVSSLNSNGNIVIRDQNKLVMYNKNGAVDVLNPITDSALNAQVLKIGTNNYHYLNSYASIGHRFVIGETTDDNHAIEIATETRDNIIYTQLKPYYNIPTNGSAICELGSPTRQFYNTYTDQVTVNSVHSLQNNLSLVCNPDETTQKNVLQWRASNENYYFNPAVADVVRLGSSSYKWASIWCTQSSLNTASDKRLKTDIKYFTEDDRYEKMFMELKPCTFKRTDSEFGRHHTGLIAQELEETMNKYDIDYTDFGALLKIPVDKDGEELDINDKKQMERFVDYQYGIRYGELIALNIHMIQKQAKEIELLKNEINKLK